MDDTACNYSLTATISGECEYPEENYDCSGNCNVEVDCFGTCGSSLVDDVCGVCGGDNSSCTGCMDDTACNYSLTAIISGECEYVVEGYDCNGNCNVEVDCAGICGGSLVDDECGICGGDNSSCTGCMDDTACNYSLTAIISGECEYAVEGYDCNGNCNVEVDCTGCMDVTACNYSLTAIISGECEYAVENYDCNGNCNVAVDCAGICGGSGVDEDDNCDDVDTCIEEAGASQECGCNTGVAEGACDCDGNVLDECGICNGVGFPEGSCDCFGTLPEENHDCNGDELSINVLFSPIEFKLFANFPNPFNPSTTINYSIATFSTVNISIYSMSGRLIQTLMNSSQQPGQYVVQWNASNFPSGLYFVKLISEDKIAEQKVLLIK
jgi:hypothetical protein